MPFNLDKNDSTDSSKKFDLSKSPAPIAGTEQKKSKSNAWLFVLPLLLATGIAIWYFLSKPGRHNESPVTAAAGTDSTTAGTVPTNQSTIAAVPADTTAAVENETGGKTTAAITTPTAVQKDIAAPGARLNNSMPATFAKGSHAIGNIDQTVVNDIIAFLEKNTSSMVHINGYASSEGELAFNQRISQSRADAFKSYLIAKGIAAVRVSATGKGISDPISTNDTEEGRIKNRRVQIVFQ